MAAAILKPTASFAIRSGPAARWAYLAVVAECLWPRRVPYDWQAQAVYYSDRCKRMAKVMKADIVEPCRRSNRDQTLSVAPVQIV
jgi:hypothetical protein